MARLLSLSVPLLCGVLGFSWAFCIPLHADPAVKPGAPAPAASAKPAPAKPVPPPPAVTVKSPPAASAKPVIPPPPAVPEDYFIRYGKILSPNAQPPYPFRLTMPAPGFGEVRVPQPEELAMREKLERLATLSDAQIRDELEKWPAYSKMSLGDQGAMLTRIQQFRDFRSKQAEKKAHDLGLLTLTPPQQAKFEQEYWNKQLQMDHQLVQQFSPIMKASEQKLNEDLFREFSSPSALAGKPKTPPPAPSSLPPIAPVKPAAPLAAKQ